MTLTTNESVGASARLNVLRLSASRLGGAVTVNNLDKDLDGTYAWKRLDGEPRLARPETYAGSGAWDKTRGDE
jgi:hypothetical protein